MVPEVAGLPHLRAFAPAVPSAENAFPADPTSPYPQGSNVSEAAPPPDGSLRWLRLHQDSVHGAAPDLLILSPVEKLS